MCGVVGLGFDTGIFCAYLLRIVVAIGIALSHDVCQGETHASDQAPKFIELLYSDPQLLVWSACCWRVISGWVEVKV